VAIHQRQIVEEELADADDSRDRSPDLVRDIGDEFGPASRGVSPSIAGGREGDILESRRFFSSALGGHEVGAFDVRLMESLLCRYELRDIRYDRVRVSQQQVDSMEGRTYRR
jgi:hypothetical protein